MMQLQNWRLNEEEGDNVEGVIDDPLMNFFIRSKLKQREVIYNALQAAEIDYDELLDLNGKEFNDIFALTPDPKLGDPILPGPRPSLQKKRLFNALKSNQNSVIFKEMQQAKVVCVPCVRPLVPDQISSEEKKALNDIKASLNANNTQIHNLSNIQLPKLQETFKQNNAMIESTFQEIIKCAKDRKDELQQELHRKTHAKQQQIQTQIRDLKEWNQQSQSLLKGTALNRSQRKDKIRNLCPILTATITEVKVQRQQIQMNAIKMKLNEVVLIRDMTGNDVCPEYKDESPSLSPSSNNIPVQSAEVTQTKAQQRRQRSSKNKGKKKLELKQQKNDSAPPPNATTSTSIMVRNTYQAVKDADKRPIVDSWQQYPAENANKQTGYKMRLCSYFAKHNGYCWNEENCNFAHGVKELKKYNPKAKTIPCEYGDKCPNMLEWGVCNYIHKKKVVKK